MYLTVQVTDGAKGIPVGQPIALLAEEGDDISNIDVSKYLYSESSSPSSSQPQQSSPPPTPSGSTPAPDASAASHSGAHVHPTSSRTLFPSVLRILSENGISEADKIKGTGVRGMITKGDVLTYLGKASSPLGTYKALLDKEAKAKVESQKSDGGAKVQKKPEPLDGPALRRVIVATMLEASLKARNPPGTCHSCSHSSMSLIGFVTSSQGSSGLRCCHCRLLAQVYQACSRTTFHSCSKVSDRHFRLPRWTLLMSNTSSYVVNKPTFGIDYPFLLWCYVIPPFDSGIARRGQPFERF